MNKNCTYIHKKPHIPIMGGKGLKQDRNKKQDRIKQKFLANLIRFRSE